jgi:methylmalonyl-CoA/ethylmalonyl-CoA epimerase
MIKKINHIAIVVDSMEESLALFSKVLGFEPVETHSDPQGMFRSTMVRSQDATCELLEPVGNEGPIAKFLGERGGGIHHISFEVDDLDVELASLREKGIRLIEPAPRKVGNDRIAFIHPRSMKGVLIELVQKGADPETGNAR